MPFPTTYHDLRSLGLIAAEGDTIRSLAKPNLDPNILLRRAASGMDPREDGHRSARRVCGSPTSGSYPRCRYLSARPAIAIMGAVPPQYRGRLVAAAWINLCSAVRLAYLVSITVATAEIVTHELEGSGDG